MIDVDSSQHAAPALAFTPLAGHFPAARQAARHHYQGESLHQLPPADRSPFIVVEKGLDDRSHDDLLPLEW